MKRFLTLFLCVVTAAACALTGACKPDAPQPTDYSAFPFYTEDPAYAFSVEDARSFDGATGQYVWSDALTEQLNPFWMGNVVYNETVMLLDDGESISGNLLFTPTEILSVRDFAWEREFREGEDFTVNGNTITLTEQSSMPYLTSENLHGENLPEGYRLVQSIANTETDVMQMGATIYTEGSLIYGHQVSVSYVYDCAAADLSAFTQFDGNALPSARAKLAAGDDLKIGIIGDSVAEGCSSSSKFNREPYLPNFIDMTALYLNAMYRAEEKAGTVTVQNYAKGGMTSEWGAAQAQVDRIIAGAPDVLYIHFGINDNGSDFSKGTYTDNIESLVLKVKNALPDCEIILIKAFTPETMTYNDELFAGYWNGLDSIAAGKGIYTLDLYAQSLKMLETKKYMDVTGNGINHLNDYSARLYTMNLLASLIDFVGR